MAVGEGCNSKRGGQTGCREHGVQRRRERREGTAQGRRHGNATRCPHALTHTHTHLYTDTNADRRADSFKRWHGRGGGGENSSGVGSKHGVTRGKDKNGEADWLRARLRGECSGTGS